MRFVATTIEALKLEIEREFDQPRPPVAPTPVYAVTAAALPLASSFANCVVRVTDLDILAVSNGAAWIRQDTGAAIA